LLDLYVSVARHELHTLTSSQIADIELPKSRRQQREERAEPRHTDYIPPSKDNILKRKRDETEHDPKLKEFLDVMQPPSKLKGWANDETQLDPLVPLAADTVEAVVAPEGESDDEYQVIAKKSKTSAQQPSVEPKPTSTAAITELPQEREGDNVTTEEAGGAPDAPIPGQGPVSDADWLRSRTNRVLDLVDDHEAPPRDVDMVDAEKTEVVEAAPDVVEQPQTPTREEVDAISLEEGKIRETGRLFLRNLHYDVTEDDLREHFSTYGAIDEVRLFAFFANFLAMMNIQIGTTDAFAYEVTWENILVDVSLV